MDRSLPVFLLSFFIPLIWLSAQCVQGDCHNGKGTYIFPSGARYTGDFVKGQPHGSGTCHFTNGDVYKGEWFRNVRQGEGSFWKLDGSVYEGGFRHNRPHGRGTLTFPDGAVFVSEWASGESVGEGLMTSPEGKQLSGTWRDGKFVSGTGDQPVSRPDGDIPRLDEDRVSEGHFKYPDGSTYAGRIVNGVPAGLGRCNYANGDIYIGEWSNHKPEGDGTMHYANGTVVQGAWKDGKIVRSQNNMVKYADSGSAGEIEIFALIVGVARYPDFESLKYTDDDAYLFFAFLKSPEGGAVPDDHIQILIDENATASNIIKGMDEVLARADTNDVVITYFAGHGLGGFFIPFDCNGYTHRLYYETIKTKLQMARARHKLCIVDACYSGSLLAAKAPLMESLNLFYHQLSNAHGGIAFLMSSKEEEFSLESKGLRQGIFSHYLIEGLKGNADLDRDRIITLGEIHDFVQAHVRTYTKDAQNPVLAGRYDRNMPVGLIR